MQNSWLRVGRECALVCSCVYLFDAVCWCQCVCVYVRGCIAVCVTVSAAFSRKNFVALALNITTQSSYSGAAVCQHIHTNTHTQRYIYNHLLSDTCMRHTHTHTRSGNPLHKYSSAYNIHTTRWGSEAYKIFICTCQRHEAPLKLSHTHALSLARTLAHPSPPTHTHTH